MVTDSKYTQDSMTFLSILSDVNCAVVWMVSILPLNSRILLSILPDVNSAVVWIVSIFSPTSCCFILFPSLWRPYRGYQQVVSLSAT